MSSDDALDAGTYEVLRGRLRAAADDLTARLSRLNEARGAVFGNIQTRLLETVRVTTEHNCVPCDLAAVGERFLFGYNVQFGLKTETHLEDVLAVYRFDAHQFHALPLNSLFRDERFLRDFQELYRFYKGTYLRRFITSGPFLYLVFRVGKNTTDIKTFKFRLPAGNEDQPLEYIDNRSEHEVRDPPQHEFQWIRTTRDQHRYGKHPHIAIDDRLFVECIGGDLTIKVEDNTESGLGIYAEKVDNKDQTLDDAEIFYAPLGNLYLLKIRPYQEQAFRYLVYNAKVNRVTRIDQIADACVLLPDDHGIIYPGGYYLQTGEAKQFDHGLQDMRFERTLAASNGEDYLYLFYGRQSGIFIQLRYNVIRQRVETPHICSGQAFFQRGEMVCFRSHDEPQKHHAIQIWQTPFVGADFIPASNTDSMLFKIGNKDLVRGMAECAEILSLIEKDDNYDGLYVDLVKRSTDVLDSYFWLDKDETFHLQEPLALIREAASAAVEEFEKVVRVRRQAEQRMTELQQGVEGLVKQIDRARFDIIDDYVKHLAQLRQSRGEVIGAREIRFIDLQQISNLETILAEKSDRLSRRCVDFLLTEKALEPYQHRAAALATRIADIQTVVQGRGLEKEIDEAAGQLELLTETVSNLRIEDATKRTGIIDRIGTSLADLNRIRSQLKASLSDLVGAEGRAEFASQLKLIDQTSAGYLDVSETPQRCDEYLTKLMIQLEEIEGKFAEFDEFVVRLTEKREELFNAFETKKVQLVEARNRRAEALGAAAERILGGMVSRVARLDQLEAIHAFFASDLMVEKLRGIVDQLVAMEDMVRSEDLRSRLKTVREDAIRQLKDRQELFEAGGESIRLGKHRFAVNKQPMDLTTVLRDGKLCLHLTGTQYFEPLEDPALEAARELWQQELISENERLYRGEYLAAELFTQGLGRTEPLSAVTEACGRRLSEGYAKGVHDHDAAQILAALWELEAKIGLLRFEPALRAAGNVWWEFLLSPPERQGLAKWIEGFARIAKKFPQARPAAEFRDSLERQIEKALTAAPLEGLFAKNPPAEIAAFIFAQRVRGEAIVASQQSVVLYQKFRESFPESARMQFAVDASEHSGDGTSTSLYQALVLARTWAEAFLETLENPLPEDPDSSILYREELAWLILRGSTDDLEVLSAPVAVELRGLAGAHPRIVGGKMTLHYRDLLGRYRHYRNDVVPRFLQLRDAKQALIAQARSAMRIDEFQPRVLSSFVRNRLIDEVYLPLVGDNLAKQIGAAGEGKRVDRMGLLLLVSPPGYGKTTLMEYIANRLGLVFVKINGPAIGHGVTSLDPDDAPHASAREEVVRLNMALEMGDNVMLYLDDIQHTHPELLQKFISLCDATRKIEGVWKGKTRTYDLRGRRVAVVMAGNPYTESGERFQIPDMLSNRADTYNLGETIGTAIDAFEESYLENALTSNPVLATLATRGLDDTRELIRAAKRDSLEGIELQGNWSSDQLREMIAVLKKLQRVRDAVLKCNRQYIRSAAQADAYRTEPPFKLQGSYRNMNRIAEKVVPVMNDEELMSLVYSNYEQDAQTLTTDNEANLLKFKELMGILTPVEQERWDAIKYAFVESIRMSGIDPGDQAGQVLRQLQSMRDGLESIRKTLQQAAAAHGDRLQGAHAVQDSIAEGLARIGQVLDRNQDQLGRAVRDSSQSMEKLVDRLTGQPTVLDPAPQPIEQRYLIQHKVPRVVLDVVRGQFHLIQEWLRPLASHAENQGQEVQRLRGAIETLLERYEQLRSELEK